MELLLFNQLGLRLESRQRRAINTKIPSKTCGIPRRRLCSGDPIDLEQIREEEKNEDVLKKLLGDSEAKTLGHELQAKDGATKCELRGVYTYATTLLEVFASSLDKFLNCINKWSIK